MFKPHIGVNNVSRKIIKVQLGVNNISRKVVKIFQGDSNDLAKLIYEAGGSPTPAGTPFDFSSNIAPTSWTEVTKGTQYTATNEYGTWTATASSYVSTSYVSNAFDSSNTTSWKKDNMGEGEIVWVRLDFPIPINPSVVQIKSMYSANCQFQLQKIDDTWVDVQYLTKLNSAQYDTINCNYNEYFKAMRVYGERETVMNQKKVLIHDFYIASGTGLQ